MDTRHRSTTIQVRGGPSEAAEAPRAPGRRNADTPQITRTSQIADAIAGPHGEELLSLIHRFDAHTARRDMGRPEMDLAVSLGWVDIAGGEPRLTPAGGKARDPVREYLFWRQRDRILPGQDTHPPLATATFKGKSVLEVGCSTGFNLFSLQRDASRVVGLEPEPAYIELTPAFARKEGIEPPQILQGIGEKLPFADGEFDVVLLCSALQYMEIPAALREAARVLGRGGTLITMNRTLGAFISESMREVVRSRDIRRAKYHANGVVNSLSFLVCGKRLRPIRRDSTTARPVYPTKWYLARQFARLGLAFSPSESARLGNWSCFIARKPA